MKLHQVKECLQVNNADLSGSVFDDVNMSGSTVENVNLAGSTFHNVNLSGATFADASARLDASRARSAAPTPLGA